MDKSCQSDPDLPGDWTFVPSEEDIMDASTPTPGVAGSCVEDIPFNENTSNAKREMTLAKPTDKDEDDIDAHGGSSRDSDIDIIDEETDNSLHSMDSSALGQTSLMSFSELSVGTSSSFGNLEVPPSDSLETAGSDASLPPGLELRPGVRRYRHIPNQRLNWSLTLLTVVVAAAAVGLGVGHYLGWSDRWFLQRKMLQPPTALLGALHEELEACVQHQDGPPLHYDGRDKRVCHEDEEYWADKLELLLLENTGLGHFLGEEASRISRCKASKVKCDKSDGPPLDLILNQIQYIMAAKFDQLGYLLLDQARTVARFKEWRENRRLLAEKKGKEEAEDQMANLEDKVKSLNEENEELRSRLGHDALREAMLISLERQVQMLQTENSQLKQRVQQAPRHERTPDITSASRMSILRDKVNHLLIENEDLRGVVARLRYSRPLQTAEEVAVLLERRRADDDDFASQTLEADGGKPDETTRADDESEKTAEADDGSEEALLTPDDAFEKKKDEVEDAPTEEEPDFALEEELSVLLDTLKRQQIDSKHWRKLYEQLRGSRVRDETGFVWKKLLGTAQTLYDHMETAFDTTLDSLFRFVRDSTESTADLTPRLQDLVTRMREEVTKKRAEFQEYLEQSSRDGNHGAGVSRTIKLLEGSLKKVFNVGAKFMTRGKKVTEAKVDKLFEKLSKVALALGKRWEKAATRGGAQNGAPKTVARIELEEDGLGKRAMDLEEEEEEKEREDWFSSRAKGREHRRNDDGKVEAENWYLKRQRWRKEAQEATKTTAKPTKSRTEKKARNTSRDHPLFTSDEEEIGYRSR